MPLNPSAPVRWGILGAGNIAHKFAAGLAVLPDAQLVAVGSRTPGKADTFADMWSAPHRHTSYESLAADPDVDVVYVATPHPLHAEDSLLCLNAGKAVLCEKPFTVNAAQAQPVIDKAREKGLFLMEGMWTRFFPIMARVRELGKEGAIGDVRMVQADFGFRAGVNPESRLFSPALAGGGLLDVGIYPLSLASMLLGAPTQITGVAQLGETGVDEQAAMSLLYDDGRIASLTTGIRTNTPHEAHILGTDGSIKIHNPWWQPSAMTVKAGGKEEVVTLPFAEGTGFQFEAQEVAACLRAGQAESAIMPLNETLQILRTMDTLRAQWGLKYPME